MLYPQTPKTLHHIREWCDNGVSFFTHSSFCFLSCLHLLSPYSLSPSALPFLQSSLRSRHCKAQNPVMAISEMLLCYYNRHCEKKIFLGFLMGIQCWVRTQKTMDVFQYMAQISQKAYGCTAEWINRKDREKFSSSVCK